MVIFVTLEEYVMNWFNYNISNNNINILVVAIMMQSVACNDSKEPDQNESGYSLNNLFGDTKQYL